MSVRIMCSEFDVGPVIVFGSIAVAKFNEFVEILLFAKLDEKNVVYEMDP